LFFQTEPLDSVDLSLAGSVLLLRYDRLGDMVISTGLFRLLKERYPGLRIHVLASPSNAGIIRHDPNVHMVHIFDKTRPRGFPRLLSTLRRERFYAAVNLVFYPSLTGAVLAGLSAPLRVRVATEKSLDAFYSVNCRRTIWGAAKRTMLEETADVFRLLGGSLEGKDISPVIFPGDEATVLARKTIRSASPRIGLNLAAGDPAREWRLDNWAETIRMILERFPLASVHIFTPPGDSRGNALSDACRNPGSVLPVPQTSDILQVAAFLSRMDLLVTPDTAMVHIADALGVSLVPMYISHEKSVLWKPVRALTRCLVSESGRLDSIPPSEVAACVSCVLEVGN